MEKTNLLKETISALAEHGKTLDDIIWFGTCSEEINSDIKEFLNVDYDSGYGWEEIPTGLIIAGDGFWLERGEYDGSEWWEFKEEPKRPTNKTKASLYRESDSDRYKILAEKE